MLDMFLYGLMCLLAVYGGLSIILGLVEESRLRPLNKNTNVKVVIIVKDTEDNIEEIVKNAFRYDFQGKALSACKLSVVDMGSEDDTLKILEKLGYNNQGIEIYNCEDRYKVFSDLGMIKQ